MHVHTGCMLQAGRMYWEGGYMVVVILPAGLECQLVHMHANGGGHVSFIYAVSNAYTASARPRAIVVH